MGPASIRGRTRVLSAICALTLVQAWPTGAASEVRLRGNARAISVDMKDGSVKELLTALKGKFHLDYRSSVDLDRPLSGSFRGSLRQVVSDALFQKDFNFVYKVAPEGDRVRIYGENAAVAKTDGGKPASAQAEAPAAPPPAPVASPPPVTPTAAAPSSLSPNLQALIMRLPPNSAAMRRILQRLQTQP